MPMHIGLNAHLLSSQAGYRSAGIHGYIHHLLRYLPQVAPDDWRWTAMVGAKQTAQFNSITMHQASWDTESPLRRILWEQMAQPFQLGQFDLLHAMAFVAPMILSKPMVVTVYDLTFLHYPERLSTPRRLYLRTFTERTCHRAKRILAISQSTADDLTNLLHISRDKIDVTPLGFDQDRFRVLLDEQVESFREQKDLPDKFWFFLGTLEPRKNLVTLIEAYAQLPESERIPLYLAGGKGWLYEDIFSAIERLGVGESVRWVGFLPSDEIPLWYNSAHAFVYPSVFEGFGLPVLEAMACGTPVMTSNVSSLPEVAGQSGHCLPPHDVSAWIKALRQSLSDESWYKQARQQGLAEAQKFRWEHTAQLTIDSYRRALD